MDFLAKSDEEIFAIAKPFWENLVKASNMKDYGSFTRDFSTQNIPSASTAATKWLLDILTCHCTRDQTKR